ncbi:hypothetical protein [Paludisphaera rhizosphaerae]|uniref:hypothetical protein n=1 Tax=Paludisphaera rhizosphaerae TaxID=2711216 RepID=UPI0013EDBE7D|nr:hypothetical protein [Paludisphaera rhizosphaerae]
MNRPSPFFHGSELPRLALLAALTVAGWGALYYAYHRPVAPPAEPPLRAGPAPAAIQPDSSEVFETVTDRTAMTFRDNAAYAYLLEKARPQTPAELAAEARRDVFLTHLWERPELYRGVPVHIQGAALRVVRFESKLSKSGWLYEAWIVTPDARRYPYDCVFEEAPEGFPIGIDVNERVVFNGYFLKVMKYQAGDTARGAPVLIGKIGWDRRPTDAPAEESNRVLFWSMVVLGAMFLISLLRWVYQMLNFLAFPHRRGTPERTFNDEIPPEDLQSWVESQTDPEDQPPPEP